MTGIFKDDSAVSETIGFILIFAIVLTCIGVILVYGNNVLDSAKSQNNLQSIEQGFTVLQSDMTQVALQQTPAKTTEIHLEEGTVTFDPTKGVMTIDDQKDTISSITTGALSYNSGHDLNLISIESGGLWMHYETTSNYAVISGPRIYAVPDTTNNPSTAINTLVLNVIKLDGSKQASGGPRTLNVKMKYEAPTVNTYSLVDASLYPNGRTVTITYTTDHPNAWQAFLKDGSGTQDDMYGNGLYTGGTSFSSTSLSPLTNPNKVTVTINNVETLIVCEHVVGINLY